MRKILNKDFSGHKILFIGIGFYDYEQSIAARLRERGADVVFFQDKPEKLVDISYKRFFLDSDKLIAEHEEFILDVARSEKFNQVFIIKSTGLQVSFLKSLREILSDSKFILYQWDSLARLDGIRERIPFFDRILTFDRVDALNNPEMKFRPLFFREKKIPLEKSEEIDITFIGWLHSERLDTVRYMQSQAELLKLKTFVYIYTGWRTWFKLLVTGQAANVYPWPLPYKKLLKVISHSKCIYDLPHPLQAGLTMRAIETLGMQKKLLTSASDIVNYDFYSAENISVINGKTYVIDESFIFSKPFPINPEILKKYSLDAWLNDVFILNKNRTLNENN